MKLTRRIKIKVAHSIRRLPPDMQLLQRKINGATRRMLDNVTLCCVPLLDARRKK